MRIEELVGVVLRSVLAAAGIKGMHGAKDALSSYICQVVLDVLCWTS